MLLLKLSKHSSSKDDLAWKMSAAVPVTCILCSFPCYCDPQYLGELLLTLACDIHFEGLPLLPVGSLAQFNPHLKPVVLEGTLLFVIFGWTSLVRCLLQGFYIKFYAQYIFVALFNVSLHCTLVS